MCVNPLQKLKSLILLKSRVCGGQLRLGGGHRRLGGGQLRLGGGQLRLGGGKGAGTGEEDSQTHRIASSLVPGFGSTVGKLIKQCNTLQS